MTESSFRQRANSSSTLLDILRPFRGKDVILSRNVYQTYRSNKQVHSSKQQIVQYDLLKLYLEPTSACNVPTTYIGPEIGVLREQP